MNLDETESKLNEFKVILSSNRGKSLNEFSDAVYLSVVEKAIIGKKDEVGKADPYHITFVFKKLFGNDMEVPTTEVLSNNEPISPLVNYATFSQHALNDYATKSNSLTRGDCCTVGTQRFPKIAVFRHFYRHEYFLSVGPWERQKLISDTIEIVVVFDLVCVALLRKSR
jgi:hypothetical protein